eukprot:15451776-Alexandrium_andersonii.AAC.1
MLGVQIRIGEAKVPGPVLPCSASPSDQPTAESCVPPSSPPAVSQPACCGVESRSFVLETVNVTSLGPHMDGLCQHLADGADDPVDLFCVQEHATPAFLQPSLIKAACGRKLKMVLSPCDPGASAPAAGVGAL